MGKSITDAEVEKARAQLARCRTPSCANAKPPGGEGYCRDCRAAHKVVREYERTHRAH